MAFTAIIKITDVGIDAGPVFDIYSDVDGFTTPFENNIPKASLIAGYLSINIPDGTTQIKVVSDGVLCDTEVIVNIPTTTTTSTTTTTTIAPCRCHEINIQGTSTITWRDCENAQLSNSYTDLILNICASLGTVTSSGGTVSISPSSTDCVEQIDCWQEFIMEAENVSFLLINVLTSTGIYAIEWEPGDYTIYSAGTASRSNTYSTPFTGQVKIKAPSLSFITQLILTTGSVPAPGIIRIYGAEISKLNKLTELDIGYGNSNARLICNTTDLSMSTLTKLKAYKGIVSGDIAALPNNMTILEIYGFTNVSGNIQNLPTGLITLAIYGSNTLTGDLANLPVGNKPTLKVIELLGQNTITGDIGDFAGYSVIQTMRLEGLNTITGNISGMSGLTTLKSFTIYGKNKLTGNLTSLAPLTLLTRFIVDNNDIYLSPTVGNEITGDIANIPSSVTTFILGPYNTVFGNISTLPLNITAFEVRKILGSGSGVITGNLSSITSLPLVNFRVVNGPNTITGVVTDLPSTLVSLYLSTDSSISGNLKDLPTNLDSCSIYSDNAGSIFTYTPGIKVWPLFMKALDIDTQNPAVPDLTNIDALVIELGGSTWAVVTAPNTWGLKLKGTLTNPAAIAAAALIDVNTAVTFY